MTLPGLRFTIVREICPFTALYPVWAVFVGSTRGNIDYWKGGGGYIFNFNFKKALMNESY